MKHLNIIIGLLLLVNWFNLQAQSNISLEVAQDYIESHQDYAITEMIITGIPASIKMAQAIVESDFGRSELSTQANNYFGIKCHNTWQGPNYFYDDDAPQECFRKYPLVYDSFVAHSGVLNKKRYAFLFKLDPYDYKAWAKGLKKAGYATNPSYANLLINIIEKYELYKIDYLAVAPDLKAPYIKSEALTMEQMLQIFPKKSPPTKSTDNAYIFSTFSSAEIESEPSITVIPIDQNKPLFHIVKDGESVVTIAKKHQISIVQLKKWNNLTSDRIMTGTLLVIQ